MASDPPPRFPSIPVNHTAPPPLFQAQFMATPSHSPSQLNSPLSNSNPAFSTYSYKISEKLNDDNYLLWLQQIEPVLRAHRLHRFCVSPQIPLQFLSDSDRTAGIENPAYTTWETQDQLLLSWLQASLSASVLAKVIGCRYSWQLWDKIHHHCKSKIKAQARQLRSDLRNTKKGEKSISAFLSSIKSIADSLLSIGETVSIQEQLDVILEGLPSEYESLVTLINSKSEWFEFDEIESLLLAHENRITKQKELLNATVSLNLTHSKAAAQQTENAPPQVNFTNANSNNAGQQSQFNRNNGDFRGGYRGGYRGRRGGRGGRGGRNNIQCQVCYKFGHDASICYHRFNSAFTPNVQGNFMHPYQYFRPQQQSPMVWTPPQVPMLSAPPQAHVSTAPPQAFIASATPQQQSQNWFVDSGASHHVTADAAALTQASPLASQEHVFLGNGQG